MSLLAFVRDRGPTVATLILIGLTVFAIIDAVSDALQYTLSLALNTTSALSSAAAAVATDVPVATETVEVGGYAAVIAKPDASPLGLGSLSTFADAASSLLKTVLKVFSDRALFVALVAIGIGVWVYEEVFEEE
jgi:hypothetical protein